MESVCSNCPVFSRGMAVGWPWGGRGFPNPSVCKQGKMLKGLGPAGRRCHHCHALARQHRWREGKMTGRPAEQRWQAGQPRAAAGMVGSKGRRAPWLGDGAGGVHTCAQGGMGCPPGREGGLRMTEPAVATCHLSGPSQHSQLSPSEWVSPA